MKPTIGITKTPDTLAKRCARRPKSVALVAMGRSSGTFITSCAAHGSIRAEGEEVWCINGMGAVIQHDRLFVMDDIKEITTPAAKRKPNGCADGMLSWLAEHPGPVYSSKAYKDLRGVVEYPLQDVLRSIGYVYMNTSVAYAVAMAIHFGVEELALFGCDFTYKDHHVGESGRACVEFLLGLALRGGTKIRVASDSTLFDSDRAEKFYGYAKQPKVEFRDGLWTIVDEKPKPKPKPKAVKPAETEAEKALKLA